MLGFSFCCYNKDGWLQDWEIHQFNEGVRVPLYKIPLEVTNQSGVTYVYGAICIVKY